MKLFGSLITLMITAATLWIPVAGFGQTSPAAQPEKGSTAEIKARSKVDAYKFDPRLPNVLIIGDSISMGYLPPLRELLKGKANVVRPVSARKIQINCEGTTSGLANLDRWLGTNKWAVIHFNFGLHDLKRVTIPGGSQTTIDYNAPRQADLPTYEANLKRIVARLEQTGASLIFATTTPVPANVGFVARTPEDVSKYNAAAIRIMNEHKIPVDDLYSFCLPKLAEIQKTRNVHFTDQGSRELAQEVAHAIEAHLPATVKQK